MRRDTWQLTCAINTTKALLPFQNQLRKLKHRIVPPRTTPGHLTVVSGGFDHIRALQANGLDVEGAHVLEIGSGWLPIIPLMFRAAGAERVTLTDAYVLMNADTVRLASRFLLEHSDELADKLGLPEARVVERIACGTAATFDEMQDRFGFRYLAPFGEDDETPPVDAVISQTVLEHIRPTELKSLLGGTAKRLRAGGLVSHGVDNTDHRSHHDPRLSRFDFLRYTDRVWKLLCLNPQDYTNRLRHSDYIATARGLGWKILHERAVIDPHEVDEVRGMPLASRFEAKTPEDLATAWTHIVARPV